MENFHLHLPVAQGLFPCLSILCLKLRHRAAGHQDLTAWLLWQKCYYVTKMVELIKPKYNWVLKRLKSFQSQIWVIWIQPLKMQFTLSAIQHCKITSWVNTHLYCFSSAELPKRIKNLRLFRAPDFPWGGYWIIMLSAEIIFDILPSKKLFHWPTIW